MSHHCSWCQWDTTGSDHPECTEKLKRRETIDSMILPVLSQLGVSPYQDNLKYKIAMLIEAQMDAGQATPGEREQFAPQQLNE